MPAITIGADNAVPAAGDTYTYTVLAAGAVFWRGGDVDVTLTITNDGHRKVIGTDDDANDFYDAAAGDELEFAVTPNKAGGDFWVRFAL